ncbi:MAG TPA: DUF177 domain-containing protein [Gaiellales bacterium]|nr:DUF177 domain-containing protein [Gaiellales bacterium]
MVDLRSLALEPGDARSLTMPAEVGSVDLGGSRYDVGPVPLPAGVDVQAAVDGLHLRLRLRATVTGACYRCTEPAAVEVAVDERQYHASAPDPDAEEDTVSLHVADGRLDVDAWAREAIVLALPAKILCSPGCPGLCPHCGVRLREDEPHACLPASGDPRWAALERLLE